MIIKATILAMAVNVMILTASASGQQAATPSASTPPAAAAPAGTATRTEPSPPDYVEVKGFKSKVLDVKNRDPEELRRVLAPLGSGFRGATLVYNDEFRTITVRDWPENIATIEEALARLDQPRPPESRLEFHVHILVGSMGGSDSTLGVAELSDVLSQLHSTLPYKGYVLVSSSLVRANDGSGENHGALDGGAFGDTSSNPGEHSASYDYNMGRITHIGSGSDTSIQISRFRFNLRLPRNYNFFQVGFDTPVVVHNGEKVVVGSSTVGDKAVIVVMIATPTK
jgi:hypothetical protein